MVAAYSAATSHVTPRATKLLIEDKPSQRALATFIGTFIFSIVGIVALQAGIYGDSGRIILFVVTIAVIVIIIMSLVRWIDYLTSLGRVGEIILRVEEETTKALEERLRRPYLGGVALKEHTSTPKNSLPLYPEITGYMQHIDINALEEIAEKHEGTIYVVALPGKFISPATPLAYLTGITDQDVLREIKKSFITGKERSFRQDPRYGIIVLSEIASRALSPAVNDPGTAIQIINVGIRILSLWEKRRDYAETQEKILYKRVHVPGLDIRDLFDDFFPPIARDGASIIEVGIRLQKAFTFLAATGDKDLDTASRYHSELCLAHNMQALSLDLERQKLAQAALCNKDKSPEKD
jgi:uncharacterized membrane protein